MHTLNFKKFLTEYTSNPNFVSQNAWSNSISNDAPEMIDSMLEFPTVSTTSPVISCRVVGKNYCIQLEGEATIYVECNKFHRMFGNRLPQRGDIVTAIWYKFKEGKNYTLKRMYINQAN
jgi:hypothetical protein